MNGIGQQGLDFESYTPVTSSATISLSSTGVTDLVNVTETGYLASVGFTVNATGSYNLEIQVDNQPVASTPLVFGGAQQPIILAFRMASAESYMFPFGNLRYGTNLRVSINVLVAGSGTINVAMIRGKKY